MKVKTIFTTLYKNKSYEFFINGYADDITEGDEIIINNEVHTIIKKEVKEVI